MTLRILLALLLLNGISLRANASHPDHTITPSAWGCNLPAPSGFHTIAVGPDWVDLGWSAPDAASAMRIRTFRSSDDALLSEDIAPVGATHQLVNNLPPDTDCYAVINAVCDNGEDGSDKSTVAFRTVILELIVIGFQPQMEPYSCFVTGAGSCNFPNSGITTFRIRNIQNGVNRLFGMQRATENRYRLSIEEENGYSPFEFVCSTGNQQPNCEGPVNIDVKYRSGGGQALLAARITVQDPRLSFSTLNVTLFSKHFVLEGFGTSDASLIAPDKGDETSTQPAFDRDKISGSAASLRPNPFRSHLELTLPTAVTYNTPVEVFHISGQMVMRTAVPAGQTGLELPVASLTPGCYMVRVETEGAVHTWKVFKQE